LRGIEIDRAKSLLIGKDKIANREISVRVSRGRGKFQPTLTADELQLFHLDLARPTRIQIDGNMFGDEIVRKIADNNCRVGNVEPFRKNIRQLDFLFRIRRARSQRRFCRIQNDPRLMHVRIVDRTGNSMAEQRKKSVVDSGKIDIDRFDVARAGRNGVQIPNDDVGEDAAFEPELEFEIFPGRVVKRDAMTDS